MVLAFVLASLTYHFVETPIRSRRMIADRRALFRAFCTVSIGHAGGRHDHPRHQRGRTFRYPDRVASLFSAQKDRVSGRCPILDQILQPIGPAMSSEHGQGRPRPSSSSAILTPTSIATCWPRWATPTACRSTTRAGAATCIGHFGPGQWSTLTELKAALVRRGQGARRHDHHLAVELERRSTALPEFEQNTADLIANGFRIVFIERTPIARTFDPSYRAKAALEDRTASTATFPLADYQAQNSELRTFFAGLERRYPQSVSILSPEPHNVRQRRLRFGHQMGAPTISTTTM